MLVAGDKAFRLYKKNSNKKIMCNRRVRKITKPTTTIVISIRNFFDKMLAVMDPTNKEDFIMEVCSYANTFKIFLMFLLIYEFFWMQIKKH